MSTSDRILKALASYSAAVRGELGPESPPPRDVGLGPEKKLPGKRAPEPLELLTRERQRIVEATRWQSGLLILLIVALAAGSFVAAMLNRLPNGAGVAATAATAVLFQLLRRKDQERNIDLLFTLIQVYGEKHPDLVPNFVDLLSDVLRRTKK